MIGERLSEIRKDHGDTQLSLAQKLDVSLPTIRAWEQEKSSPSHEMLVQICKLYHISADYLLGLSSIDPAYTQQKRLELLSKSELEELLNYEKYLIWKRRVKG